MSTRSRARTTTGATRECRSKARRRPRSASSYSGIASQRWYSRVALSRGTYGKWSMGNISSMSREQLKFKFNAKAHREFRFADTVVGLYDFPVHNDQRATVVVMSHITG